MPHISRMAANLQEHIRLLHIINEGQHRCGELRTGKKEPEVFQAIKRKPMPKEIFLQDSHSRALILLYRNGISQTQSLVITKEKLKEAGG